MRYAKTILTVCLLEILLMCLSSGKTMHVVYNVKEHSEVGSIIGDLQQMDKPMEDSSVNTPKLDFKMPRPNEYVSFNAGRFFVKRDIDREIICTKVHQCCCIDVFVFLNGHQTQIDYFEVRILIDDINDHAPSWPRSKISLNIPEHTKKGTKYRLPSAVDLDSSLKFTITKYNLVYINKKAMRIFSLVTSTDVKESMQQQLWLRVDGDIDREIEERFQLRLVAEDSGDPPLTGSITLIINVTDINDNEPYFVNALSEVYIRENNQPNDYICQVVAKDKDISDVGNLRYSFSYSMSQEEASKFYINDKNGKVYVTTTLDYENDSTAYYLPIQVTDGSNVAESTLIVKLLNENDNPPIIMILPHVRSSSNVLMVQENSATDKTLATITVSDIDNRTTIITCRSPSTGFDLQRIDAQSGSLTKYVLSLSKPLDRENEEWFQVILICNDDGYPQQSSKKLLKIQVLDRNDCFPQIMGPVTTVNLKENLPKGSFVVKVNATDCDSGLNARLMFGILKGDHDLFTINKTTGVIRTNVIFDRETMVESRIIVTVYDRNNQSSSNDSEEVLSSSTTIKVTILDMNDCAPVFSKMFYEFSIAEGGPPRTFVGSVAAKDADVEPINRQITFSIISKPNQMKNDVYQTYFYITQDGGIYTTNRLLDREQIDKFTFGVEARDGPTSKHVVTVDVVIKIEDVNDNHPQWSLPTSKEVNVNISQDETVGRIITILRATDDDIRENSDLNFEITQGNELGLFRLDMKSGSLYLEKPLPKKGFDVIRLMVKVFDNGKVPLLNTTTIMIRIIRESLWLSFEGRHLEKDLVVMICMISVTLIVSGILIVAIILLKCKPCFKTNVHDAPSGKNNRPENPDGRSSPTMSEMDNSPKKLPSDLSLYHSHICRPRGFIYEAPSGMMGFEPISKPNNLPIYYTLKSRNAVSEPGSEHDGLYLDKQSPPMVSLHNTGYSTTRDHRTLPSSPDSLTSPLNRNQMGNSSILAMSLDSTKALSGGDAMRSANIETIHLCNHRQPLDKKLSTCVKWSDMVDDKGVYEAFCHQNNNTNSCQMSKDQITSFV